MAKRVNSYNLLLGLAREGLVISHSMACLWGSGDQLKQCGGDGEDLLEQQVVGKEYLPLHCLSSASYRCSNGCERNLVHPAGFQSG